MSNRQMRPGIDELRPRSVFGSVGGSDRRRIGAALSAVYHQRDLRRRRESGRRHAVKACAIPLAPVSRRAFNDSGSDMLRLIQSTSGAGVDPIQDVTRHAVTSGRIADTSVYDNARAPADRPPLCTKPTARPQYLSRMISPISTAPADHSAPKARPCIARSTNNSRNFRKTTQEGEHGIPQHSYIHTRTRP